MKRTKLLDTGQRNETIAIVLEDSRKRKRKHPPITKQERLRQNTRRYRLRNPKKISAYNKMYKDRNRQAISEYNKRYYQNNRETELERARSYREKKK
jgi:hypothetical protein